MNKLISIRFSHYVEKVRWVLDHAGISYQERPLMPINHFFVTPFYIGFKSKADKHSTMFSTPILRIDNKVLSKSTAIVSYIDKTYLKQNTLFPTAETAGIDQYYTDFLGPHTRRLFYESVLANSDEIKQLALINVGPRQAKAFNLFYTLIKDRILESLAVDAQKTEKSIGYIYKEFDKVEKTLSDGRPFLEGDRFGMADISFACMGGAITLPSPMEGYGAMLPALEGPDNRLKTVAKDLRSSVAGKYALKLFKDYRGDRKVPCLPLLPDARL